VTKVVRDFEKCYLVGNFRGVEVWDGTGLHFITSKLQKDTGARHKRLCLLPDLPGKAHHCFEMPPSAVDPIAVWLEFVLGVANLGEAAQNLRFCRPRQIDLRAVAKEAPKS